MKKTSFLFVLISFSLLVNAQSTKISGSWLMTKAEIDGKTREIYSMVNFSEGGNFDIDSNPMGTWKYDKKKEIISMKSEIDKKFNGDWKVITLTSEEFIINKENVSLYYSIIDHEEIEKANSASGLIGIWKFSDEMGSTNFLKIEAPNTYTFKSVSDMSSSTADGEWMYNLLDMSIVFTGSARELRGKSQVIKLNAEELVFEHKGITIEATIESAEDNSIEHLNYSYEDFDEEQFSEITIPWMWTSLEDMVNFLSNLEYLKYSYGNLIEDSESFNYKTTLLEVDANTEKNSVVFTNLQISNGDTLQFGQDYKDDMSNSYNNFFPQAELDVYRIIGTEAISSKAGAFDCTVIEGIVNEEKIKFWMINDKPGVYAKIIREGLSHFGDLEYHLMELEEIK